MREIIIIGSGPAGLTAAIYCARANRNPLCITGMGGIAGTPAGGQLMWTTDVENYPGFPEGIEGPELMEKFREQAARFGTDFIEDNVTEVDFSAGPKGPFKVTAAGETHEAKSVIVCTGARPKMLGLEEEDTYMSRGLSTCATCDGAFFKDRELIIVGGGDSAMEEACYLTRHASRVSVVHRRDELRASKIMQDRAKANEKIDWHWSHNLVGIEGDGRVQTAVLKNLKTDDVLKRPVDGIFYAIGHIPNTTIFEGHLDMDDEGYIKVSNDVETSVEGVFTGGDVHDHTYRQAVTAAGLGCMAALGCEKWLEANG